MLDRFELERKEKWQEIIEKIPFISFPKEWKIQIIPPFGGAIVRFRVVLPDRRRKSVYLDFYDVLGCVGEPYWEVYPVNGDTERCSLNEIDELLKIIEKSD